MNFADKLKAFWAEAVIVRKIVFKVLKALPLKLVIVLADGKISDDEFKDLLKLVIDIVTKEIAEIADKNLEELE